MVSSGWTITGLPVLGTVIADDSPAIAGTDVPTPPDPPDFYTAVTGNAFNAEGHFIRLTGGFAQPGNVPLANTDIEGTGNGMLTSNLVGGQHQIVFSMDVDDSEPFPVPGVGTIDLLITGTVVGRTQITAIPEPSGLAALTMLGGYVAVRRRRR